MRRLLPLLALWLVTGLNAVHAELQVKIEAAYENYLLYAPVVVRVIIQNNSEIDLAFQSEEEPWLSFIVTRSDGSAVRTDQKLSVPPMVVKAGTAKGISVNLTPHYSFRELGNYKVCAAIDVPGQRQVLSGNLMFNINQGQTLISRTRPVEGSERTYSLVRFSPDSTSTLLFLRVEDLKENLVYSTVELGPITATVVPPQYGFDKEGRIHVLQTIGQGSYRYSRANSTGAIEHQGNYEGMPEIPPRLATAADGAIMVVGGQSVDGENRRERLSDAKFNSADSKEAVPAADSKDAKNAKASPVTTTVSPVLTKPQ